MIEISDSFILLLKDMSKKEFVISRMESFLFRLMSLVLAFAIKTIEHESDLLLSSSSNDEVISNEIVL